MDKSGKTKLLSELIATSVYVDDPLIGRDERTYDHGGVYVRFHDVSTGDEFRGFVPLTIPNPSLSAEDQLAELVDIYGDETIVKSTLNSEAIKLQSACRKIATGGNKTIPQAEFDARFDRLDADIIGRLKDMKHIREHIVSEWESEKSDDVNGIRLF